MFPAAKGQPNHLPNDCNPNTPRPTQFTGRDEPEEHQHDEQQRLRTIHQLLARQLEYYFSTSNLAKDTYVSTLRSLNDGYVPISIIANFGKVQSLAPFDSALEAVQTAATSFSKLLEVVHVDSITGKRVRMGDTFPAKSVIAVGPVSGEPIPMDLISTAVGGSAPSTLAQTTFVGTPASVKEVSTVFSGSLSSGNGVQNTVILRETPEAITQDEVLKLFAFDGCPPIESVHLDFQNCWFVTLKTSSRDAMVDVMLKLRTQRFSSGEPVKARLKSSTIGSVSPSPVSIIPGQQFDASSVSALYAPELVPSTPQFGKGNGNKKKQLSKGRRFKGTNQNQQASNGGSKKENGSKTNGKQQQKGSSCKEDHAFGATFSGTSGKSQENRPEPPRLGEDDFPSLPPSEDDSTNKIEVEKVPDQRSDIDEDEFEKNRMGAGFSDSSSTATTSTSSTPSPSQPTFVGGYAAALLRPAAPPPVQSSISTTIKEKHGNPATTPQNPNVSRPGTKAVSNPSSAKLTIEPPSWGGGRSFADVLRKEQETSCASSRHL